MYGSGFEKVLLSAILTSCTVFSVLTLGFLPRRAEPISTEPQTGESIEAINQRDVVIRHIGLSIVVSVGAGIATAELIRKWGRSRTVAPDGRQVLSAQATLQAIDAPDTAIAGLADSLHRLTNGDRLTSGVTQPDRREFQTQPTSVLETDRKTDCEDAALPLSLFQPLVPLSTAEVNWFPLTQSDSALPTPLSEPMQTTDWAPTWHPILAVREQYQTCRIQRSDASERLFAILFDGQYYRFVKTASKHEQALRIATRLDQRGEAAVITYAEERYTVWALEPDACPETTAFSQADSTASCCAEHLVAATGWSRQLAQDQSGLLPVAS